MAILVGDPIVAMRALGPDPCGVLPQPLGVTVAAVAGGSLPAATWYVRLTQLTPWGESTGSSEQVVTTSGGNLSFSSTIANLAPGVTAVRVYFGWQAGLEAQYQQFSAGGIAAGASFTATVSALSASSAGFVPQRSSAYIPDSDGGYVSAAIAYRWLNQALRKLAVQLGGIRDVSGVAWPSLAAWQVLNGRWTEIETLWWQGWYQQIGRQEYTWLQNPVTSVPGYATHWSNAGQDIIGLWPQPGQGPGATTLAQSTTTVDTTIQVAAVANLQLPGMFQIDDEYILASNYTGSGPYTLVGIIRGVGGSVAASHSNGAALTQLITMFSGSRLAPEFAPGSSYTLLQLPAGWDAPLDRFLLARYKEKEQDMQAAALLDQEFNQWIETFRSSKDAVPKDRAVGDGRVYNSFLGYQQSGALPFGVLVP